MFDLCRRLGIDDPVAWMNAAPPVVVDQWMAYEIVRNDEKGGEMESPEDAHRKLLGMIGNG